MKIDLSTLDPLEFDVRYSGDRVLITPRKDKHLWSPEEVWFRSVVTDLQGSVISMGFPKFLNYHENQSLHEEALQTATQVFHAEKLDGSLIVVTWLGNTLYARTRGSFDLGSFAEPVEKLFKSHPKAFLDTVYHMGSFLGPERSHLFEYVGPENQVVLKYDQPRLVFLGTVKWQSVNPQAVPVVYNDPSYLAAVASFYGLHTPKTYPGYSKEVATQVSASQSDEGIVVTCISTEEKATLFKVKSSWYLMMHALRFQMTPKRLMTLLAVEGDYIKSFADLQRYLFFKGYDFELATFFQGETEQYFQRYVEAENFQAGIHALVQLQEFSREVHNGTKTRKQYVESVRQAMIDLASPAWIFPYSMNFLDGKDTGDIFLKAHASRESPAVVETWLKNKQELKQTLLKPPTEFQEMEE